MRRSLLVVTLALVSVFSGTSRADTPAQKLDRLAGELDYLKTRDGFMYWFGAMDYQATACKAPLPEAVIDAFAKRAGVTKQDVAKQDLNSPFVEGYKAALSISKQRGLQKVCETYRSSLEQMRERGLF